MAAGQEQHQCCRCYRKGQCLHCSCVKIGQHCTSCLQLKLGKCVSVLSQKKFDDVFSQPSPCASSRIIIAPITSPSQPLPDLTVIQLQSDVPTSPPPSTSDLNTNFPNSTTPTPRLLSPSLSLPAQTVSTVSSSI